MTSTFDRMKKENHANIKNWIGTFFSYKASPYWQLALDYFILALAYLFIPSYYTMFLWKHEILLSSLRKEEKMIMSLI